MRRTDRPTEHLKGVALGRQEEIDLSVIRGSEERQALCVIPMQMTKEDHSDEARRTEHS